MPSGSAPTLIRHDDGRSRIDPAPRARGQLDGVDRIGAFTMSMGGAACAVPITKAVRGIAALPSGW
jgi:hypothetical protein